MTATWTDSFAGRRHAPLLWLLFLAGFAGLFLVAYYFTIPQEDAVILYEYSKNLASGGVITYGGAGTPIEGATDFLWMLIISLFSYLGLSEFGSSLFLNFCALILMGALTKDVAGKMAFGIGAALSPFLYASLNGFSAIFFSASFVVALLLALRKSRYLYIAVLMMCLLRPDGVAWGVGLVLYRLVDGFRAGHGAAELRACILALVLPGVAYFWWRSWYFSELLPLPFLVKAAGGRDFLGLFYAESAWSVAIVALPLLLALAISRNGGTARKALIFFAAPVLFYASMRLEQNVGNRFLAPLFFGALFLLLDQAPYRAVAVFLVASIGLQMPQTVAAANTLFKSENTNVFYLSQDLRQLSGRMLVTEAGRLAYYSNWRVEDSWGLNTPRFAHDLIHAAAIKEGNYDLIVAHCELKSLDDQADLRTTGERLWANQCNEIISFIKKSGWDIYLVPFETAGRSLKDKILAVTPGGDAFGIDRCRRHDIYAISPAFAQSDELKALLVKYGGVPYKSLRPEQVGERDQLCAA